MWVGQWIGQDRGTSPATVALELDSIGEAIKGHFYFFEDNPQLPSMFGTIELNKYDIDQQLSVTPIILDRQTGLKAVSAKRVGSHFVLARQ